MRRVHSSARRLLIGLIISAGFPLATQAQVSYPNQPIRLVVPFAPGGGNDYFARAVGPVMSEILGQPVVVDNRPGGAGAIGASVVGRQSPADGYSILLSEVTIHSVNPHLQKALPYNAEQDLKPIARAGTYDYMLVVNPKFISAKTLHELRALVAKEPHGMTYGTPGVGTPHHLGMELLASKTGMKLNAISYRGAAPAVQDLLSGQIQMMLSDRAAVRNHIKAGSLKAIAVAGSQRVQEFPDVPTIAESGVADFAMESWFGFSARTGTSDVVVQKIADAYAQAIAKPALVEKLREFGINVAYMPPNEFASFIHGETQRWGQLIRERGIKVD